MSGLSIQYTLSDHIELQNKSLQGKMFCESIMNCLKGDEDFTNITQPYNHTDIDEGRQKSHEVIQIQNIPIHLDTSSQADIQECQENDQNKQTLNSNSKIYQQKSNQKNMSKLTEKQQTPNHAKKQQFQNAILSQLNYDKMKVELSIIDIKKGSISLQEQCKEASDLEIRKDE